MAAVMDLAKTMSAREIDKPCLKRRLTMLRRHGRV